MSKNAFRPCLPGRRVTLVLGGLPQHSHISSFLHDVFTKQVVVTLALSDTRVAICVSLASFAFDSCDFFPFRINEKIICELVSWKSWYCRHWVKPLGLPSLIVLRLFCSCCHLKFSWRKFSASQGRNSSIHFNVIIYLKSCSASGRLRNLHWIWIRCLQANR